jgi:putative transposase
MLEKYYVRPQKPGTLTVHADCGSSMTSKPVAFLLADLGLTRTHNRPCTSTDNRYSEAHFKTLKYRPEFPDRFQNIEQARDFVAACSSTTTTSTATQESG